MRYLNDCVNPVEHRCYVAVDTWLFLAGTANAPAHHSYQIPFRGGQVDQRTPTVTLRHYSNIYFNNISISRRESKYCIVVQLKLRSN